MGSYLGYSLDSEQEVLKLFYFLPITSGLPSNLQEPNLSLKGVVFSFTLLSPKSSLKAKKQLLNRVFASVEAVVSAPLSQQQNLLGFLKKLDFKTHQTSEFLVVESYEELVAARGKEALFISDFLFDYPPS